VNPGEVRADDRLLTLRLSAIPRRFGVREHLYQRSPVDAVLLARGTLRQFAGQHSAANLGPLLHVCIHSSCLALGQDNRGFAAIVLTDTAAQLCAAFFDRPGYPAPRCTFRPAFTAR